MRYFPIALLLFAVTAVGLLLVPLQTRAEQAELTRAPDVSIGLGVEPDAGVLYSPISAERASIEAEPDSQVPLDIQPDTNVCMLWGDGDVEWEEDLTREHTQASLEYWVLEYRIGQIKDLSPEYVRSLFDASEELDADTVNYLGLLDGPLGEAMTWPGRADVERLWREDVSRDLYESVLVRKLASDMLAIMSSARLMILRNKFGSAEDAAWVGHLASDVAYQDSEQARHKVLEEEEQLWRAIWASDRAAYPHWAFLMEVANRHFML